MIIENTIYCGELQVYAESTKKEAFFMLTVALHSGRIEQFIHFIILSSFITMIIKYAYYLISAVYYSNSNVSSILKVVVRIYWHIFWCILINNVSLFAVFVHVRKHHLKM